MSFSAEPKVAVLQENTQAADPVPHPHSPKLAPKLSQEGKRQLWSSGKEGQQHWGTDGVVG